MHPLLAIGLLITVAGVFADALGINTGTKQVKFTAKEKPADDKKPAKESKPAASDSEP